MKIRAHSYAVAVTVIACTCLFSSCQKDESLTLDEQTFLTQEDMQGMIKLGKRLENPYTIENMKKALSLLEERQKGRATEEINVRVTHLYLRFLPEDSADLEILKQDTTLILWDYPLDYEITEGGDFYHDPEVPLERPTPQYCAVEADKVLPEVPYELLSSLYIPEEDEEIDESSGGRAGGHDLVTDLLLEAFRLTGNEEDFEPFDESEMERGRWYPYGRVRVWEHSKGRYVPVVGVKVRVRRWFRARNAYTDKNGIFRTGRFRSKKVNYSIRWERPHYSIRSGTFGQAWLNGPKRKRKGWYVDLGRSGARKVTDSQQYYALIHQAAYAYYYGSDIFGLKRPPLNSFWKPQMKISAYRESGFSFHSQETRTFGLGPWLKIREYNKDSHRIYSIVIHELAHASHWDISHWHYNHCDNLIKESWADAVAAYFTARHFGVDPKVSKTYYYLRQNRNLSQMKEVDEKGRLEYTPIFIDMIDDFNQGATNKSLPIDRVRGFTLVQIERALGGARNRSQFLSKLKRQNKNHTEKYLEELFDFYD